MWRLAGLVALGMLASTAARADDEPFVFSVERHATSNALDGDLAIADFYTLLRGSIHRTFEREGGHVRLNAEFQASKFDKVSIEDDAALALAAEVYDRIAPGLEVRGSISWRVASEGDDLAIGPLRLGARSTSAAVEAKSQLGIDLGRKLTLVLEASDAFEQTGRTRFQEGLLAPARLDPDRNRAGVSATISRKDGPVSIAASAAAMAVTVEKLGDPPVALSFTQLTLAGEAVYAEPTGALVGLAVGLQALRGAADIFSDVRPTYKLRLVRPLPFGLELRGMLGAAFETQDSDDPLASWLRRGEIELRMKFDERLAAGVGLFDQMKENLLLENRELSRGLYVEANWQATPRFAVVLRADYARTFKTVIDERKTVLDAYVGLRAKL
jgi:hypothetical protein